MSSVHSQEESTHSWGQRVIFDLKISINGVAIYVVWESESICLRQRCTVMTPTRKSLMDLVGSVIESVTSLVASVQMGRQYEIVDRITACLIVSVGNAALLDYSFGFLDVPVPPVETRLNMD